jgi:hypothetical protein
MPRLMRIQKLIPRQLFWRTYPPYCIRVQSYLLGAALTAHAVAVAYEESSRVVVHTHAGVNDRMMPQSQFALRGALRPENIKIH